MAEQLGGEENVIAHDVPKARGNGGRLWPFIYLYSLFNIIVTLSGDVGDEREGEEVPSCKQEGKGREGKGTRVQ